jgi:RimJ/RimL family protein N-acetyltransferase
MVDKASLPDPNEPPEGGQAQLPAPQASWPSAPRLQTKRLFISPMTAPSMIVLYALNNKEHMRFSEQRRIEHTVESEFEYLAEQKRAGNVVLEICRGITTIGTMSCTFDRPNRLVDLSILIAPAYCHRGFGKEAWEAVLTYWLGNGGMDKAEAGCAAENFPMRDLMSRCGMEYEGTREKHFAMDDGTRMDMVMFGKTRTS